MLGCISPPRRFANCPPLFVHTESSSCAVKTDHCSHNKPVLLLLKRRGGTRYNDDVCVFFFKVFPGNIPAKV